MVEIRTRVYRKGVLEAEGFPVAEVSDHLRDPGTLIWIDLCGPTGTDLARLTTELGLHELAVEDALEPRQRPKLDHYADHLFLTCYAARLDAERGRLQTTEIGAFIHPRWLVTVRPDDRAFLVDRVTRRWDRSSDLAVLGVGFLLYGLLDVVIDDYFEVVESFDEYYDRASEGIFAERPIHPAQQRSWFETRRALARFHHLVVPLREATSALMRREQDVVPNGLAPYFQDLYDHILRVSESTESLRDLVTTIVETNLSLRDYRQNQVMKKVSSWAAIIAVPTLITGYYGMNVPYPGLHDRWGAVTSSLLIVLLSGSLYLLFRRKQWL